MIWHGLAHAAVGMQKLLQRVVLHCLTYRLCLLQKRLRLRWHRDPGFSPSYAQVFCARWHMNQELSCGFLLLM